MLQLDNPHVIVRSGDLVVLVGGADLDNLQSTTTQAQIMRGGRFSPLQPLQVIYKFLHDFTELNPPIPWIDPNV